MVISSTCCQARMAICLPSSSQKKEKWIFWMLSEMCWGHFWLWGSPGKKGICEIFHSCEFCSNILHWFGGPAQVHQTHGTSVDKTPANKGNWSAYRTGNTCVQRFCHILTDDNTAIPRTRNSRLRLVPRWPSHTSGLVYLSSNFL